MPEQFIVITQFRVAFTGEDFLMFLPSDSTLFLELNHRPTFLGQHRPRQPGHVEGEVLEPSQKDIRADGAVFQHTQEVFRAGFQNGQLSDGVERLVPHRPHPTVLSRAFFELGGFVHNELPGAGGNLRVSGRQISAGDLQIDGRLLPGLVFRVQKSRCLRAVTGMQTLLFARQIIVKIIPSAFLAAVKSELLSHNCFLFHSDEVTTVDSDSGREQVGVTQDSPELNSAGTSAGTRARHFHNSLQHSLLGMEPMAGIEPATDGLRNRCSTAELHWLKTIENKAFYAVIFAGFLGACILNLYMVCFFVMKTTLPSPTEHKVDVAWVKTPYPNLIRYKPSGTYFGRVRVNGKLIRRSLETHVLTVAKLKLSDFLQNHRRLAVKKGQSVNGEV